MLIIPVFGRIVNLRPAWSNNGPCLKNKDEMGRKKDRHKRRGERERRKEKEKWREKEREPKRRDRKRTRGEGRREEDRREMRGEERSREERRRTGRERKERGRWSEGDESGRQPNCRFYCCSCWGKPLLCPHKQ